MLEILNNHKIIKLELQILNKTTSSLRSLTTVEIHQILADKMYTFKNFEPVFTLN